MGLVKRIQYFGTSRIVNVSSAADRIDQACPGDLKGLAKSVPSRLSLEANYIGQERPGS